MIALCVERITQKSDLSGPVKGLRRRRQPKGRDRGLPGGAGETTSCGGQRLQDASPARCRFLHPEHRPEVSSKYIFPKENTIFRI